MEFHDSDFLRSVGFRDEVIPRATYPDPVLSHGDARTWVTRFARGLYAQYTKDTATKDDESQVNVEGCSQGVIQPDSEP